MGDTIHDTAHLTGGFNPTGSITFDVYNSSCTTKLNGSPIAATASVAGAGDYTSQDFTPSAVGAYKWVAHYSGDGNNHSVDTTCGAPGETSTVNPAKPTIATTLSNASITVGDSINDSATLSNAYNPTGTVTYTVYTDSGCTAMAAVGAQIDAQPGAVTLTSGHPVPNSPAVKFNKVGTYYWQAVYSGDSNNAAATSTCVDETLAVAKATPTVGTTLHKASDNSVVSNGSHLPLGTSMKDVASLTGAAGIPFAGTVTFTFFTGTDCNSNNGTPEASVTISGSSATSSTHGPLHAGNYSFNAKYVAGTDPNYTDSTASDCEPFIIDQAASSSVTAIHNAAGDAVITAPVALGTSVYDSAAVSSANSSFKPSGSVTFTFYSSIDCSTGGGAAGSASVNGTSGVASPSSTEGPLHAGVYSFKAHYAGDGDFSASDATCEPLNVNQAASSSVTAIHNAAGDAVITAPVALGTSVYDSAAVSSANSSFKPSGSVTFTFYSSIDCSTGGGAAGSASVNGTSGVASPSSTEGPLHAGVYSFKAHYAGDGDFSASDATCEPLNVNQAASSSVTAIHNAAGDAVITAPVALGTSVYDSAAVSSANSSFKPSGSVTFTFYSSIDCSTGGGAAGSASVNGTSGVASPSSTEGPLHAGVYSFKAHYAGDGDFSASDATCEPLNVNQAQLDITTRVEDTQNNDITGGTVGLGSLVHDVAPVTGAVSGFTPSGGVSFVLYNLANCQGLAQPVSADSIKETGDVRSVDVMNLVPGNYGFIATVAGDSNYVGKSGVCEPFTVAKATTATTTAIHDAAANAVVGDPVPVALGTSVYDSASVTSSNSAANPSGNVSSPSS